MQTALTKHAAALVFSPSLCHLVRTAGLRAAATQRCRTASWWLDSLIFEWTHEYVAARHGWNMVNKRQSYENNSPLPPPPPPVAPWPDMVLFKNCLCTAGVLKPATFTTGSTGGLQIQRWWSF